MKLMITGHRVEKLHQYDVGYIFEAINDAIEECKLKGASFGLSGMASGCDLWFCELCAVHNIPYAACIPFETQNDYMDGPSGLLRKRLIQKAASIYDVRNRYMVENADLAIVVWDGNKGGTHNCLQQLIEHKKDFLWINPVKERMVWC